MHYIVQENCFREANYDNLIKALNRLGLSYEIVNVLPFVEEVDFKSNRKDVFVFGSLKLSRIAKQYDWNPGSTITNNHDYRIYSKHYAENMLNADSAIQKFGDDFVFKETEYFFRPCEDNKAFNGRVYDKYDWEDFKKYSLTNGHASVLTSDTSIQICKVKRIHQEARFWIVDGNIVTQSTYKIGSRVTYDSNVDKDAHIFCESMLKLFQLSKTFVMDVCLTPNGWKIVECGATSHAGFYDADLQKILIALEDAYK